MTINHPTAIRNTLADAIATAVDAAASAGKLKYYTASFTTLLATLTLPDPCFPAASGGKITADAIPSSTAVATGTATLFKVTDGDDNEVFRGTIGVAGSGADLILGNVAITSGGVVSCSKLEYNAPV